MKYEHIPFLPGAIAELVAREPYTGSEWSVKVRCQSDVDQIEALRREMTPESVKAFGNYCEGRCRGAFDAKAEWFMKLLRAKGDGGRDQLYVYTSHWLGSYLRRIQQKRWQQADEKAGLGGKART